MTRRWKWKRRKSDNGKRRAVIDADCLNRFRGPGHCDFCKRYVDRREPHHLIRKGIGGGSQYDVSYNIAALCAAFSGGEDCHGRVHSGHILRCEIVAVVSAREGLLQGELEDKLNELRWDRSTEETP